MILYVRVTAYLGSKNPTISWEILFIFYWFLNCSVTLISFSSLVTCCSFHENRSHILFCGKFDKLCSTNTDMMIPLSNFCLKISILSSPIWMNTHKCQNGSFLVTLFKKIIRHDICWSLYFNKYDPSQQNRALVALEKKMWYSFSLTENFIN